MIVELLNVRPNRIVAVPYRDGSAGVPYVVPSGCVVEAVPASERDGVPADLPASFALDGQGWVSTPQSPARTVLCLGLTGLYRMPSGEIAAVYGAVPQPVN